MTLYVLYHDQNTCLDKGGVMVHRGLEKKKNDG